ncbi:hypothetical protein [Mucilaginibacter endophyticus]|uniref:hypothetical protein n=1 Tax=Mucilaginibacter endophyticus TaxID=2675003 RepID=UPI000E0CFDE5|nr:hypothetical protein [Mucilaginibacter endophyticus]
MDFKGKILNSITGEIVLSESIRISSITRPAKLKEYFGQKELRTLSMGNGWVHYSIKNIQVEDNYFIFIFLFYKDLIKTISFVISSHPFSESSWNDWNKETEEKNKSFFENWLSNQIGSQRNFAWGNVNAVLDEKVGGSAIVLNYIE